MKRKVIQDFANVCNQMFLTSHNNSDRINFVIFGSGIITMDFLSQRCTHNRLTICPLFYCISYRKWLGDQCAKHGIDFSILEAVELSVTLEVKISRIVDRSMTWMTTFMEFDCSSRIVAYKKEYTSKMSDCSAMGLSQIIPGHEY